MIDVVLVEPEIPWNTGNVGRTCLAVGARLHLIRPFGFTLDEKRVKRAGLDYWEHVKPTIWPSWSTFEAALPKLGPAFFFSAEADLDFWQAPLATPCTLIFGSESRGLPPELRERYCDHLIQIPMAPGPVRSLNLSTSVAVALYEVQRRMACAR